MREHAGAEPARGRVPDRGALRVRVRLRPAEVGKSAAVQTGRRRYGVPVMPSLDGNTVELSTEQTLFAENAVQYRATLSFLEGRISTIRRALKGE